MYVVFAELEEAISANHVVQTQEQTFAQIVSRCG
jgi:hypothetical protein